MTQPAQHQSTTIRFFCSLLFSSGVVLAVQHSVGKNSSIAMANKTRNGVLHIIIIFVGNIIIYIVVALFYSRIHLLNVLYKKKKIKANNNNHK